MGWTFRPLSAPKQCYVFPNEWTNGLPGIYEWVCPRCAFECMPHCTAKRPTHWDSVGTSWTLEDGSKFIHTTITRVDGRRRLEASGKRAGATSIRSDLH